MNHSHRGAAPGRRLSGLVGLPASYPRAGGVWDHSITCSSALPVTPSPLATADPTIRSRPGRSAASDAGGSGDTVRGCSGFSRRPVGRHLLLTLACLGLQLGKLLVTSAPYFLYHQTGIDQASLSKLLSGERGLSLEALDKLGQLPHLWKSRCTVPGVPDRFRRP